MPLPSALAARLAKRGILSKSETATAPTTEESTKGSEHHVEEVFAEDYDDPESQTADIPASDAPVSEFTEAQSDHVHATVQLVDDRLIHESPACPNRTNTYHECTDYCSTRWGFKPFSSDPITDVKRMKMLKKHPLPEDWEEVGDPETGRFYYWNTTTDEVSWLPPTHPRTNISLPAERLKELFEGKQKDASSSEEEEEDIMDIDDFEEIERKILMEKSAKEKGRRDGRKPRREESLDPMDPAAYSDIPRGTWSTGLDLRGSAKTGVDATASGPLFQMRPYPSPGAILRMNKEITDDSDK